ncbi:uncharacterized protein LOC120569296 isoform X3 [Perca fluviatilis]|uniref:uncharacterized protein LOC120569296 isoform X3 n=1 Tax=Perca fluviatilis TaxID=8168 RepID=UPI001962D2E3|nr:uncharacterized protein LOC120569296 isoform X3 [Perca fluviatilis]
MAGLCWMAVVLVFSLSVGNTGTMTQNEVQAIVNFILNNNTLSPDTEDDSFRDLIEHLSPPEKGSYTSKEHHRAGLNQHLVSRHRGRQLQRPHRTSFSSRKDGWPVLDGCGAGLQPVCWKHWGYGSE